MVRLRSDAKILQQQNRDDWSLSLDDALPSATDIDLPAADFSDLLVQKSSLMQSRMLQLSVGTLAVGVGYLPEVKGEKKALKRASKELSRATLLEFGRSMQARSQSAAGAVNAFTEVIPRLEEQLPDVLSLLEGTANFCTNVPVVGSIVKVLTMLGRGVKKLVELKRKELSYGTQQKLVYPPMLYTPSVDIDVANREIARFLAASSTQSGADYTQLFSPPSLGRTCFNTTFYTRKIEGGGTQIERTDLECVDGTSSAPVKWGDTYGYLGALPGGSLHQGIYFDQTELRDLGPTLLPSSAVLASTTWAKIAAKEPGPSLYCIAAGRARDRWMSYIGALRTFLFTTDEISSQARSAIVKMYARKEWFGWSSVNEIDHGSVEDYRPVKALDALAERQMEGLDTLLCAYVSQAAPALRFDPELRDKLEENRGKLLSHPARCRVDLDSVVDVDFREALRETRQGAMTCAPGMLTAAKTDDPIEQTGVGTQDDGLGETQKKRPSSALPLLGLAAIGAAGYALAKRR